jgi:hypothetical protein
MLAVWFLVWFGFLNPIAFGPFKLGNYVAFVVGSAAKWSIFAGLIFLFLQSLPDWLRRRLGLLPLER